MLARVAARFNRFIRGVGQQIELRLAIIVAPVA
jgi:hypothetical protein